jgi:hypothetical protein
MISIRARAMLVACAFAFVSQSAHAQAQAQEAVDGYKPPSAAIKTPQQTGAVGQAEKPQGAIGQAEKPLGAAAGQRASTDPKTTAAGPKKIVGLISTVGDTFTVKAVGVTTVATGENKFPVPAWKANDRVATAATNILKKNFIVKRIAASDSAFASLHKPKAPPRDTDEEFKKIVRNLAGQHKADYYLVITPGGSPFNSGASLSGLGVARTKSLLGADVDYVHALTAIRIYDSQFNLLRSESGTTGEGGFLAEVKGPHQVIEDEAKPLPPEPQAAMNDPRAKQIVLDLLDKSIATTLPKLLAQD